MYGDEFTISVEARLNRNTSKIERCGAFITGTERSKGNRRSDKKLRSTARSFCASGESSAIRSESDLESSLDLIATDHRLQINSHSSIVQTMTANEASGVIVPPTVNVISYSKSFEAEKKQFYITYMTSKIKLLHAVAFINILLSTMTPSILNNYKKLYSSFLIDPQNTHPFQCSVLFSNSTLTIIPKTKYRSMITCCRIEVCVFLELTICASMTVRT